MSTERPSSVHGAIALSARDCTSCNLCVTECPTWCITLRSHTETLAEAAGGRSRKVKVLEEFTIDFGLCMFCGICVEVCPFDALAWVPEPVEPTIAGTLVEGIDELGARWPGQR